VLFEKVSGVPSASNNRVIVARFESILLAALPKILFQQHRSHSPSRRIAADGRSAPGSGSMMAFM
jgi:hypothetical protein